MQYPHRTRESKTVAGRVGKRVKSEATRSSAAARSTEWRGGRCRWDSAAEWGFLPWMRAVILFLGILHAALTAFGGLTLLVLDFPLAWAESTQEVLDEAQKKRVEMEGRGGASTGQVSSSEHRDGPWQWASSSSFKVTTLQRTGSLPPPMADHKEVWVNPVWVLWRSLKREPEVMAWTTFLVISALGVASSPILFVFCLFDYFRLPGGQMVFRALRTGAPGEHLRCVVDAPRGVRVARLKAALMLLRCPSICKVASPDSS